MLTKNFGTVGRLFILKREDIESMRSQLLIIFFLHYRFIFLDLKFVKLKKMPTSFVSLTFKILNPIS